MHRVTLEPVGRFAIIAVVIHAAIGGLLWWWLHTANANLQQSPGQNLTWVSPSDFSQIEAPTPATPPVPASTPTAKLPEPPKAELPKPDAVASTPPAPSGAMAAVQPAPATATTPEPDDDNLPKAIAIDPREAAVIMSRSQVKASTPLPPAVKPEPKEEPKPTPEPEKETPPLPSKPAGTPAPSVAPPITQPEPPETPDKPTAPPPPPPPGNDVSRFVTVTHSAPEKSEKGTPKVASLGEIAALDSSGTGATGANKGIRLDEVDRAIINAFLREWLAPDASKLSLDQRTVSLNVIIDRNGQVIHFATAKKSGSDDLDLSVLEAADRLGKIDAKLPPTYPSDRYEFQVNFHVE